jgi:DNA-binding response OmpR family regulator
MDRLTRQRTVELQLLSETSTAQLDSALQTFTWMMPAAGRPENSVFEQIGTLRLENYQLALVPLHDDQSRPAEAHTSTNRFLLLPWTWKEFVTRMKKQVEGENPERGREVLQFADVQIDLAAMEVRRNDRLVDLTAMEFKVLRFFLLNPGRVISRDELLNQVWGYNSYPCTRTVDNHILRLRQKLEAENTSRVHFQTVRGIGYRFRP